MQKKKWHATVLVRNPQYPNSLGGQLGYPCRRLIGIEERGSERGLQRPATWAPIGQAMQDKCTGFQVILWSSIRLHSRVTFQKFRKLGVGGTVSL